ncbi:N-carbamoylsarcosine amidase [Apiospora arundinis]
MLRMLHAKSAAVALVLWVGQAVAQNPSAAAKKPNIVLIFTDDQDLHLNSLEHMPTVQKEIVAKGTTFNQHYATVAKCCPSRASLLRGQAAHNTNITDVHPPGGNYDKWLISKENDDYLPHWLVKAGYNAEYLGKFLNGHNILNYGDKPKGWTHMDALLEPYMYSFNNVVMSADGKTPLAYHGYHQSDILRAKANARIDYLAKQDKPFHLTIAPTAPHNELGGNHFPVPLARHKDLFPKLGAPRGANWGPTDAQQKGKPAWIKHLPALNATKTARADEHYRLRIQTLQGVDDIVADVVDRLAKNNILDNTYIIYTSDNGYHIGNHRVPAGKSLPYREDTNLPFLVRGPGVPGGAKSDLPGAHVDLAPTFLDIAGVTPANRPDLLDGRSLLDDWHNPQRSAKQCPVEATAPATDVINVEFWGKGEVEAPWGYGPGNNNNTYKTLRIVGGKGHSYLYSRWCTGETELYDTAADPAELTNLAAAGSQPDAHTKRLLSRLNGLLMATKSCATASCRNPWRVLQPEKERQGKVVPDDASLTIRCLDDAMQEKYDDFFDKTVPQVHFDECLEYQFEPNEKPFWGPHELGRQHRQPTDNYVSPKVTKCQVARNKVDQGGPKQRNATIEEILKQAKELTPKQVGPLREDIDCGN